MSQPETAEIALTAQLTKAPERSRKFMMTRFGILAIIAVFGATGVLFLLKPAAAGSLIVLAQVVVGGITSLVGIFCGAQAAVDYRNSASLASVVESKA